MWFANKHISFLYIYKLPVCFGFKLCKNRLKRTKAAYSSSSLTKTASSSDFFSNVNQRLSAARGRSDGNVVDEVAILSVLFLKISENYRWHHFLKRKRRLWDGWDHSFSGMPQKTLILLSTSKSDELVLRTFLKSRIGRLHVSLQITAGKFQVWTDDLTRTLDVCYMKKNIGPQCVHVWLTKLSCSSVSRVLLSYYQRS